VGREKVLNNLRSFYSLIVKVNCPKGAWLRRGKALALLVLGTLIATLIVTCINLLEMLASPSSRAFWFLLSDILVLAIFSGLFLTNRAGRVRLSAYAFLILLVASISGLFPAASLDRVTLAYAIPTIAASFLISPFSSFLFWALSAAGYTLALIAWGWSLPYNYFSVLSLFLIALVSWLASSQLENALSKVQRSLNGEEEKTSALKEEVRDEQAKEKQLERLNRALRTISECNQALVRTNNERELLRRICRVLVEAEGYRLAWVSYAENKNRGLRLMAKAGENLDSLETLNFNPNENNPTWEAMSTGKPVVFSDLRAAGMPAPWAEKLRDWGCSSSIFLPLKLNEKHAGIIAICSTEPGAFDEEESALLLGLAEDVSFGITAIRNRQARERAERALRESEERFRTITQNAQDMVFRLRLSPTPGFEYVSPAASWILGYTPEEHYSDSTLWSRIVLPEDQEILESIFRLEAQFNQTISVRFTRKDGKIVWTEQRSFPLLDDEGKPVGLEGIVRDVTARKTAEEEIQRARMNLLYSVSHELKTPLMNLITAQDFLKSFPEEQRLSRFLEYESIWQRNLKRLHSLINNLVDSQRTSTSGLNLKLEPCRLEEIVREVVEGEAEVAKTLEITMRVWKKESAGALIVLADREAVFRIVENILSNALKFSPRKGEILIQLWRENSFGCFSISDQGPGIPLEEQKDLFQPFQRATNALRSVIPGTGLGLYVTKMNTEALKGDIRLKSETGKGTTVTVRLPLHNSPTGPEAVQ